MKVQTTQGLIKDVCCNFDNEANGIRNHCCIVPNEDHTCIYFKNKNISRCKYFEKIILPQAEVSLQQSHAQKITNDNVVNVEDYKHLLELFPNMDYPEKVHERIKELTLKPSEAKRINIGNQRRCSQCNNYFIATTNANTTCPDCKGTAKTKREKFKKANYRAKKKLKKK
jgi:hypothetical protein